jgi:uncharacterized protein (TIGR02147 family)
MGTKDQGFIEYLQQEFEFRKMRNPRYSMRAFAQSLGSQIGVVSSLLNGKRTLTPKTVEKFGLKLGLDLKEIQKYQKQIKFAKQVKLEGSFQNYKKEQVDTYSFYSNWINSAILMFLKAKKKMFTPQFLGKKFNVKASDAKQAIERIQRLDLIKVDKSERVKGNQVSLISNLDQDMAMDAGKNFHRDMLNKSLEALEVIPRDERDHTGMTMTFSKKDMKKAKELITKFRREFLTTFDKSSQKDEVYQLEVSFFPLTEKDE